METISGSAYRTWDVTGHDDLTDPISSLLFALFGLILVVWRRP